MLVSNRIQEGLDHFVYCDIEARGSKGGQCRQEHAIHSEYLDRKNHVVVRLVTCEKLQKLSCTTIPGNTYFFLAYIF